MYARNQPSPVDAKLACVQKQPSMTAARPQGTCHHGTAGGGAQRGDLSALRDHPTQHKCVCECGHVGVGGC
eukprot:1160304-Pelagomonas_calceolata.AAC.4